MSRLYMDLCLYWYKNVTNEFHIVGKILKLQAPECQLDARRWHVSKARGMVPCSVCVHMYIGMQGCAACRHVVSVLQGGR